MGDKQRYRVDLVCDGGQTLKELLISILAEKQDFFEYREPSQNAKGPSGKRP